MVGRVEWAIPAERGENGGAGGLLRCLSAGDEKICDSFAGEAVLLPHKGLGVIGGGAAAEVAW